MGLSVMKKSGAGDDNNLLTNPRYIFDKTKKDTLGVQYDLLSGPTGTTVKIYKDRPEEHHVSIPGVGIKVMAKDKIKDYITSGVGEAKSEDTPLKQLNRLSNIIKEGKKNIKE
jgi:hypothetical protein